MCEVLQYVNTVLLYCDKYFNLQDLLGRIGYGYMDRFRLERERIPTEYLYLYSTKYQHFSNKSRKRLLRNVTEKE